MAYPANRQDCDGRHDKIISYHCQEETTKISKHGDNTSFGARLIEAFNGASKKEIAGKIGVEPSTITDYTKNGVYPTGKGLIKIAEITQCNLHWLLTGEGDPGGSGLDFLEEGEQELVERLAEIERQDVDDVLRSLVLEGLRSRAHLFIDRFPDKLGIHELKEVEALLDAFKRAALPSASERKVSSR